MLVDANLTAQKKTSAKAVTGIQKEQLSNSATATKDGAIAWSGHRFEIWLPSWMLLELFASAQAAGARRSSIKFNNWHFYPPVSHRKARHSVHSDVEFSFYDVRRGSLLTPHRLLFLAAPVYRKVVARRGSFT
jgi:hypothetical protein